MSSTPFSSIASTLKKQITALTQTLASHSHAEGNSGNKPRPPLPRWQSLLRLRFRSGALRFTQPESSSFFNHVPHSFYALWLDSHMLFSSAYFENADDKLEHAQRHKLNYLCRTLRLKPDERLLEIGCGWGTLIFWAAQHYGVYAHGIALNPEQYAFIQNKILELGLEDRVSVELIHDYDRGIENARYDKIVGGVSLSAQRDVKGFPRYFAYVYRLLKPGGVFLNQCMVSFEAPEIEALRPRFINRSVFLAGQLATLSQIQKNLEQQGFELHDMEALRTHQTLTLRHWIDRLEKQQEAALAFVSEQTLKEWHVFLTACTLQFESGQTGLYQMVLSKKSADLHSAPLTRKDIYQLGEEDEVDPETIESLPGPSLTLKNF